MKKTGYNWAAHHARRVTEMGVEARARKEFLAAKVMTNADKLALFEKSLREFIKNV
jgi:hypothetical protein